MVTKRQVEEKLAPLAQNRKRMKANKEIIDTFKDPGTKVECNIGGEWIRGTLIELEEDVPTRPKVNVAGHAAGGVVAWVMADRGAGLPM